MALKRYGMLLKKYLKGLKPMKYSELTNYLYEQEKYLYEFAEVVKLYLKDTYPEPKTNEFIVMVQYNNMIIKLVVIPFLVC